MASKLGLRPSDSLAITANFISWNNAIIPDVLLKSFYDYKFYLLFIVSLFRRFFGFFF